MPNRTWSLSKVWAPALCTLALACAACADEAQSPEDDDSDDVVEEDAPSQEDDDAVPKRDAAAGGKSDAAAEAGSAPPARDAAAADGMMDGGTMQPRPGPRIDGGAMNRVDAATMVPVPTGDGGSVSGIAPDELEMLRTVCVDQINTYRATLSLPPITRASPAQELCSDQGAKMDGDTKTAHSSAGRKNPCAAAGSRTFPGFGSQNTCPGYPVGRGSATIAAALQRCLMQMWAEGEPPEGEAKCKMDYQAGNTKCFLAHGHYLNMKAASKGVSCGFYNMGNNTFWMNQDFF